MGRPPYAYVERLLAIAERRWREIDGESARKGIDLLDLRLDRYVNALFTWALERVAAENVEKWLMDLDAPRVTTVARVDRVPQSTIDSEMAAFHAAKRATS